MLANSAVYATIPAADMERALRWYEEKLGLKPSRQAPDGATFRLDDGTSFFLYPTETAGKAPNTLMAFRVTDLAAVVGELKRRGVVFDEFDFPGLKTINSIATLPSELSAWFKDSEGNILAIGQDL